VTIVVVGILLSIGVPTYLRSQRTARLRGAAQELQGTLSGLRNLAQTGKQIGTSTPDGYCLRVATVNATRRLQSFSFEDGDRNGRYTPPTGSDFPDVGTDEHILNPAYVPVPVLDPDRTTVRLTAVYLADQPIADQPAADPIICFEPPNARVTVIDDTEATRGNLLSPTTVAFELADAARTDEVLRVQLDSITGRVTHTTALSASNAPVAEEPPTP